MCPRRESQRGPITSDGLCSAGGGTSDLTAALLVIAVGADRPPAVIGALADAATALDGKAGTTITAPQHSER